MGYLLSHLHFVGVGLPRFRGHYLKGAYDVQNADQISGQTDIKVGLVGSKLANLWSPRLQLRLKPGLTS
jgi:hypothetical protein